jgi:predicted enzyme related to lactoylglutathione lyase
MGRLLDDGYLPVIEVIYSHEADGEPLGAVHPWTVAYGRAQPPMICGRWASAARAPTAMAAAVPAASTSRRSCYPLGRVANVRSVAASSLSLVEFPADDPERARRFWSGLLGVELRPRDGSEGEGWQTGGGVPAVGVHARGRGPGDSFSLPYFVVSDTARALVIVEKLGGSIIHPGDRWAICKDSEGNPFGLSSKPLDA